MNEEGKRFLNDLTEGKRWEYIALDILNREDKDTRYWHSNSLEEDRAGIDIYSQNKERPDEITAIDVKAYHAPIKKGAKFKGVFIETDGKKGRGWLLDENKKTKQYLFIVGCRGDEFDAMYLVSRAVVMRYYCYMVTRSDILKRTNTRAGGFILPYEDLENMSCVIISGGDENEYIQ